MILMSFKTTVSLVICCLDDQYIDEDELLTFSVVLVLLLFSFI